MRIGYARVSTEEQNLSLQLDALTAAGCERIFRDEGVSAVAVERPQFQAALAALRRGDTLLVWKMDRAFRSLLDALRVLEELAAKGVEFRALTEAFDTATPMGRFNYQIRNAFSELERALIAERTKAGMEAARRRGTHLGRPPKLAAAQVEAARAALAAQIETLKDLASRYRVCPRTLMRAITNKKEEPP
ncbi:MAG: recombinase family protein [Rhodospirillaceae bacterium]|nr:recombinase family protein [Rhodospirillaceae bacterium]